MAGVSNRLGSKTTNGLLLTTKGQDVRTLCPQHRRAATPDPNCVLNISVKRPMNFHFVKSQCELDLCYTLCIYLHENIYIIL